MFTQHSTIAPSGEVKKLDKPGPTVRLIAQDQNGQVHFAEGEGEAQMMADSAFFQCFAEATPEEIEAAEKKAKPKAAAEAEKTPSKS